MYHHLIFPHTHHQNNVLERSYCWNVSYSSFSILSSYYPKYDLLGSCFSYCFLSYKHDSLLCFPLFYPLIHYFSQKISTITFLIFSVILIIHTRPYNTNTLQYCYKNFVLMRVLFSFTTQTQTPLMPYSPSHILPLG